MNTRQCYLIKKQNNHRSQQNFSKFTYQRQEWKSTRQNRNQCRIKLSDPYTFDAQYKLNWTLSSLRTTMKCPSSSKFLSKILCVVRYGSGFTKTSRRDYRAPCAYSRAKRNFGLISGYWQHACSFCAALSLVCALFWFSWRGIRRYVFFFASPPQWQAQQVCTTKCSTFGLHVLRGLRAYVADEIVLHGCDCVLSALNGHVRMYMLERYISDIIRGISLLCIWMKWIDV